jgi:hypothetical protein
MSIIFQLFSAENLKDLTRDELDSLKKTVNDAVDNCREPLLKASLESSRQLSARIESYFNSKTPQDIPEVLDTLKRRAQEVFRQLTSVPAQSPGAGFSLSKTPTIFNQLLSQEDFDTLDKKLPYTGRTILEWAIICEMANLMSYDALQGIQEDAARIVRKPRGPRLKDPDSVYSLFNELSPSYHRDHPRLSAPLKSQLTGNAPSESLGT